jgi:hypothetical protein
MAGRLGTQLGNYRLIRLLGQADSPKSTWASMFISIHMLPLNYCIRN